MFGLHICLSIMCVPGSITVQKSLDLALELLIVVCHYVHAKEHPSQE